MIANHGELDGNEIDRKLNEILVQLETNPTRLKINATRRKRRPCAAPFARELKSSRPTETKCELNSQPEGLGSNATRRKRRPCGAPFAREP